MKHLILSLLSVLALSACLSNNEKETVKATLDGAKYSAYFHQGKADKIWENMSNELQSSFGSFSNFQQLHSSIVAQSGDFQQTNKTRAFSIDDVNYYEALNQYSKFPQGTYGAMLWMLDNANNDKIIGFNFRAVQPAAATDHLSYQSPNQYRLPFNDQWFVLWGGHSVFDNYHADTSSQRFAYDFLVLEKGRHFSGTGQNNEDHYCFGKPIYSPVAGEVIAVASDVPDNTIPIENEVQPLGNHVGIKAGEKEYVLVGHLKQNTVQVQLGEQIQAGDYLGECGNTGLSDLPHLHIHAQNTPAFLDIVNTAGLPIRFADIKINGQRKTTAVPVRGQRVENSQQ